MADRFGYPSRRAVLRGAMSVTVLGAGAVLSGCGATQKLGVGTEYETTGSYGVSEPQRISYGSDGSEQYGMLAVPVRDNGETLPEKVPVVVMIHGGSWEDDSDMTYMTDIGTDLVSHGVAVWAIAYRGTIHPDQMELGPARSGWPVAGYDVAAGVDFVPHLAEHTSAEFDTARTVLLGHSAGGHLAAWAASRHKLAAGTVGADPKVHPVGCVAMAGIYDLVSAYDEDTEDDILTLMGGTPRDDTDVYQKASPQDLLPIGLPVIACHGLQDELVPAEQAETYVAEARQQGDPAELELLNDADHDSWVDVYDPAWELARQHVLGLAGV